MAEASVDLDVPAERAWQALTAWREQGRWMPMTSVEVTSGTGGLGTVLRARTGVGRFAVVDEMRIDVYEAPERAEVEHLGRIVTGRGIFTVTPLPGDRSRVTWAEEAAPGSIAAKVPALAEPFTKATLGVALRRLAKVVDSLG